MSSPSVPKEWTDTWNLFDERRSGTVSRADFKHIVRSLGRKYTEAEFADLMRDLGDLVQFDSFVEIMRKAYTGPTEEDLRTALQAFDTSETGMLQLSELVVLLSTLGEKMPESDVRQLLAEVQTDEDGRVSIEALTTFLCSPVPSITPNIEELQQQLAQVSPP